MNLKIRPIPFIILFVFLAYFINDMVRDIHIVANDRRNLQIIENNFVTCTPPVKRGHSNRIVLRIDDIQTQWLFSVQKRMIEDAEKYGFSLNLGIIPANTDFQSSEFNYLKKKQCLFEPVLHGWDHSYPNGRGEFALLTKDEAKARILLGRNLLQKEFGREIISFIPPYNEISLGTYEALTENGFKVISALGEREYDFDATTYDFDIDTHVSAIDVLKKCDESFSKKRFCVVMIHPTDFATNGVLDNSKYNEYRELLRLMSIFQIESVLFSDLLVK